MHNIDYAYVKFQMREREAGLRRAQLSGLAYESRPRRRFAWPFGRRGRRPVGGSSRIAPAS